MNDVIYRISGFMVAAIITMKLKRLLGLVFIVILLWSLACIIYVLEYTKKVISSFFAYDALMDVAKFFNDAPNLRKELILIDKKLLETFLKTWSNKPNQKHLFYHVTKHTPITFALFYRNDSTFREQVLEPLYKAWEMGFWVGTFIMSKPRKPFLYHVDLPLGFILRKYDSSIIIEIVLLYERKAGFWWHGSFHQDSIYNQKLSNLNLANKSKDFVLGEEGAIDKFEVKTINLNGIELNVPGNIPLYLEQETKFVECDYELAEKYYRTFGKNITQKSLEFMWNVRNILMRAKTLLDDIKLPFWISSGTLLGYYRQCDVIPYSRDVDIGILNSNYRTLVIKKFLSNSWRIGHEFGRASDGYEISFILGDMKLDIFTFYDEGEYYCNYAYNLTNVEERVFRVEKYKYSFPKFTLCWSEFLELKLRVPCETETYIRANYGPHWFTPLRKWNWASGPFNAKKIAEYTWE